MLSGPKTAWRDVGLIVLNSNSDLSKMTDGGGIAERRVPLLHRLIGFLDADVLFDLFFALEMVLIVLVGYAAAEFYVAGQLGGSNYLFEYLPYLVLGPALVALLLSATGCYARETIARYFAGFDRLLMSVALGFTILLALGFILGIDDAISRVWIVLWFVGTTVILLLSRAIAARLVASFSSSGVALSTLAIYGDRIPSSNLISELRRTRPNTRIVGVFGPADSSLDSSNATFDGDIDALLAYGRTHRLDTIVIAHSTLDARAVGELLTKLSMLPSEVLIRLGFERNHVPIRQVHALEDSQLLEVQRKPITGWGRLLKSMLDTTLAAVATVALAPLFAVIAFAIKLDSTGPVFFRQTRHGFNQTVFTIWKFRTMTVMEEGDKAVQALPGDARVTRVGRFLRRTSLDELPQLFNVLAGDMSIVGPRPHPLALNTEFEDFLAKYRNRLLVKPGITGWAQINGYRGPTRDPELMRRRVEHDLDYIENWSIWLDLKIIAATPFSLILGKNAL